MGTSGSSGGPGPGVPMVPPWADAAGDTGGASDAGGDVEDAASNDGDENSAPPAPPPTPIAPPGRFGGARRSLASFSNSGSSEDMRRGLGHYVSKGYGGASTATRRMGKTTKIAGGLSNALSGGGARGDTTLSAMISELRGKSAREIIDGIVDAVAPVDGSQDAEASRESVREVLAELVEERPNADLLELDDASRDLVVERFVAADVYRRIALDIGKKIQDAAPNASAGLQRLRQVKDFVRETVRSAFQDARNKAGNAASDVAKISRDALQATFTVFEGYLE